MIRDGYCVIFSYLNWLDDRRYIRIIGKSNREFIEKICKRETYRSIFSEFKEGTIFDYYFDEKKGTEVLDRYIARNTRHGSTLLSFFVHKELSDCLIPRKNFFDALIPENYPIIELRDESTQDLSNTSIYVRFWKRYETKQMYFRQFFDIIEAFEKIGATHLEIKFNGNPIPKIQEVNGKFFLPFLIPIRSLVYTNIDLFFYNGSTLIPNEPYGVLGGKINGYELRKLKRCIIPHRTKYLKHWEKSVSVLFVDGQIGIL